MSCLRHWGAFSRSAWALERSGGLERLQGGERANEELRGRTRATTCLAPTFWDLARVRFRDGELWWSVREPLRMLCGLEHHPQAFPGQLGTADALCSSFIMAVATFPNSTAPGRCCLLLRGSNTEHLKHCLSTTRTQNLDIDQGTLLSVFGYVEWLRGTRCRLANE